MRHKLRDEFSFLVSLFSYHVSSIKCSISFIFICCQSKKIYCFPSFESDMLKRKQKPTQTHSIANSLHLHWGYQNQSYSSHPVMAEGSGSSRDEIKDRQLSEAQAGIKTLNLCDPERPVEEISRQSSTSEIQENIPVRHTGKSTVSFVPESSATAFKEQQLKQLRAQCLVYRAFRNGLTPKELHLEIALGTTFSREGD